MPRRICPTLTHTLSLGGRGTDGLQLQVFLNYEYANFSVGYFTSYFGPITQAAVKQWQKEHTIVPADVLFTTAMSTAQ
jgi:peptidoglycan hydrolase-like protein with peptidoglycan-binding domain